MIGLGIIILICKHETRSLYKWNKRSISKYRIFFHLVTMTLASSNGWKERVIEEFKDGI
jgi:hypothetical protein